MPHFQVDFFEFPGAKFIGLWCSQSKLMLNIIARVLHAANIRMCRIDGSVVGRYVLCSTDWGVHCKSPKSLRSDRQQRIDAFNTTAEHDVCLLTTRACAYGITLTGADRVIIYDPSWNPAEDRQASLVVLILISAIVLFCNNRRLIVHIELDKLETLSCTGSSWRRQLKRRCMKSKCSRCDHLRPSFCAQLNWLALSSRME